MMSDLVGKPTRPRRRSSNLSNSSGASLTCKGFGSSDLGVLGFLAMATMLTHIRMTIKHHLTIMTIMIIMMVLGYPASEPDADPVMEYL